MTLAEKRKQRIYIKECFKLILQQKFVLDVIVFDCNGIPKKSTMDEDETLRYTGLILLLIDKSRATINGIDTADELMLMRVRTKKFEIIVTKDDQLYFMVFQEPKTEAVE